MIQINKKKIYYRILKTSLNISIIVIGIEIALKFLKKYKILLENIIFLLGFISLEIFFYTIATAVLCCNLSKRFRNKNDYFAWKYNQSIFFINKIIKSFSTLIHIISSVIFLSFFIEYQDFIAECFAIFFTVISLNRFIHFFIFETAKISKIYHLNKNVVIVTQYKQIKRNDNKSEECCICLNNDEKEWGKLECNHSFHYECINQWIILKNTCPICRA